VLGRDLRFLSGPSSDAATLAQIEQALATPAEFRGSILSYRKDGGISWNEVSISPVRDEKGVVTHSSWPT